MNIKNKDFIGETYTHTRAIAAFNSTTNLVGTVYLQVTPTTYTYLHYMYLHLQTCNCVIKETHREHYYNYTTTLWFIKKVYYYSYEEALGSFVKLVLHTQKTARCRRLLLHYKTAPKQIINMFSHPSLLQEQPRYRSYDIPAKANLTKKHAASVNKKAAKSSRNVKRDKERLPSFSRFHFFRV